MMQKKGGRRNLLNFFLQLLHHWWRTRCECQCLCAQWFRAGVSTWVECRCDMEKARLKERGKCKEAEHWGALKQLGGGAAPDLALMHTHFFLVLFFLILIEEHRNGCGVGIKLDRQDPGCHLLLEGWPQAFQALPFHGGVLSVVSLAYLLLFFFFPWGLHSCFGCRFTLTSCMSSMCALG